MNPTAKHAFPLHVLLFLMALLLMVNPVFAQTATEAEPDTPQAVEEKADDDSANNASEDNASEDNASEDNASNSDSKADGSEETKEAKPEKPLTRTELRNRTYSKRAPEFVQVFDTVIQSLTDSVVAVKSDDNTIAMGTIVGKEGFILTKASEMRGQLKCKLANGEELEAIVYGIDPATDLAMLKIDISGLSPADLTVTAAPKIGQWLATPGTKGAIGIGVVSVDERKIPPAGGFIGISSRPITPKEDIGKGVRINEVTPKTPASNAGLKEGDYIVEVEGEVITDFQKLQATLKQYAPGDIIDLTVMRADKEMKFQLTLGDPQRLNPQFSRSTLQNSMGSTLSSRKHNFPLAFQHDSQLQANSCGSPIVDLSGKVVGINIARQGRVSSLALPTSVVGPVIERLITGKFKPAVVNESKIVRIDAELKKLRKTVKTLAPKTEFLSDKMAGDTARKEELERILKDVKKRLDALNYEENKAELEKMSADLSRAQLNEKRLSSERHKLATGRKQK